MVQNNLFIVILFRLRPQWASMNPSSIAGTSFLKGRRFSAMTLAAKHLRLVNWGSVTLKMFSSSLKLVQFEVQKNMLYVKKGPSLER